MIARRLLANCLRSAILGGCLLAGQVHAGPLLIGAEDDWYPFTALRDGQIKGMSVDIVKAAFAAADTDIQLVSYPYARCMKMALEGALIACFNTAPDARIASEYRLPANALFSDDILLWSNADKPAALTSLDEIAGKRVAVTIGYEYGSRFDSDQTIERVSVRKDLMGFLMLERRRVEYVVAYRGTAAELFKEHPELTGKFVPVATVHQPQLYLSFSRRHPEAARALQAFDEGMQIIHSNGRYQQIIDQWQDKPAQ